ncbi:TlpA disulfide reductase family protein [Nakamurella flavida]
MRDRRRTRPRLLAAGLAVALLTAGCSSGNDAAVFGGTFTFVSPDGKIDLSYPTAERGTVQNLSGTSVSDAAETVSLDQYTGKVVVLNFWGSWCAPCRAEADDLNRAADELAGDGVQFLGLNVKDARDSAADFASGKQTPYPSIYDPGMATLLSLRGFPTSGIPSTIVLDREHRVAQIWLRGVTADEIVPVIRQIATEQ